MIMDYKTFIDLLTANPSDKLAFVSGKAGEVSGHCAVVDVTKGDTAVVVKLEAKGAKFFETSNNALKVLAKVTEADALTVSVSVDGKVFVLDSAAADEGYVLGKVS
jgi:hypothetical protein